MTSRRNFFKKTAAITLGAIAGNSIINKAIASVEQLNREFNLLDNPKFILLPLSYSYGALEPYIDKTTMEIHHSKHHQAYVNNLNKAMETIKEDLVGMPPSLENIFNTIEKLPVAVRNNAGGHYNHSLFWTLMAPPKDGGGAEPKGKIEEAIKAAFGSFDTFKKQFADAGMKRFGSGWIWLVKTKENKLAITSTANQDNPLMNLPEIEIKGEPILALDVWEHAYYLKNENRRADYIASWWNIVNWKVVEELYNK